MLIENYQDNNFFDNLRGALRCLFRPILISMCNYAMSVRNKWEIGLSIIGWILRWLDNAKKPRLLW